MVHCNREALVLSEVTAIREGPVLNEPTALMPLILTMIGAVHYGGIDMQLLRCGPERH